MYSLASVRGNRWTDQVSISLEHHRIWHAASRECDASDKIEMMEGGGRQLAATWTGQALHEVLRRT